MSEISRDTLMAYLDNELDAATRVKVEADAAAMAEVAAYARQSDAIRTLYAPVGAEPLPSHLDPHRLALQAQRRQWRAVAQAAMIVCVLGIGIAAGWLLRPSANAPALYDRLIADAVSAHTVYVAENRHAVEVASNDSEHLSTWLSNRLDTTLAMPDLSVQGLTFLGGRLLPAPAIPGGRAAQLMYENAAGERTTLYITPATGVGGPAYESVRLGTDQVLYWANTIFTCTIVGTGTPEQLQAIANAVFAQLSPGASPLYES
ncbi:anti-sigma factor family protein [Devosia rhizoryzae]|uniref:Anti-sigma factor n=1 Tax=Devosia rhizoryzae TaxID=2774137 RepID=A0ABX7C8G2_9HYPH|nr:anti-sigma factor [Devosia rhizoryzae]QQR39504.1 anti-sigma factor [Devosia rhizoryzae]